MFSCDFSEIAFPTESDAPANRDVIAVAFDGIAAIVTAELGRLYVSVTVDCDHALVTCSHDHHPVRTGSSRCSQHLIRHSAMASSC